jgi:osmoprotectant transport system permease protein
VNELLEGLRWIADGAHWSGPDGIPARTLEHVQLSAASLALAAVIAIPVGLAIGHTRRGSFLVVQIANVGRAVPSLAILGLMFLLVVYPFPAIAFGFLPTLVALILLGIPPILVNTYVGIEGVDADAVEAARGMGMTGAQVLFRLEVPLAMPLIMTGLRLAAVQIVATATLSAIIAGGALGRYIVDGYAQDATAKLVAGSILVALLAIATEVAFSFLVRATAPRVTSDRRRRTG